MRTSEFRSRMGSYSYSCIALDQYTIYHSIYTICTIIPAAVLIEIDDYIISLACKVLVCIFCPLILLLRANSWQCHLRVLPAHCTAFETHLTCCGVISTVLS